MNEEKRIFKFAAIGLGCIIAFSLFALAAFPQYRVWQQAKEGEAMLAKAEQDRQIAILEARAKKEAAEALAEAEVARAKGIAQANEIIGGSLNNNEAYLRWLWIDSLKEIQGQIIYIPTEAGIPVTEANRNKN